MPSSLTTVAPPASVCSTGPPVSVCGTGARALAVRLFSGGRALGFARMLPRLARLSLASPDRDVQNPDRRLAAVPARVERARAVQECRPAAPRDRLPALPLGPD